MSRSTTKTWLTLIAILIVAAAIAAYVAFSRTVEPAEPGGPLVLGERTKTAGCTVNGALPDRACTPGAVFANVTKEQICRPGYAKSVRDVPDKLKQQVYAEYGVRTHRPGEYEIDHLVSLELGGSNDIANLFPEGAEPRPGFHEKDRYENYLHDQVCGGKIGLQDAERQIAENWLKYWEDAGRP